MHHGQAHALDVAPGISCCAVVPLYNHGATVGAVCNALASHGLQILVVDDGSSFETKEQLRRSVAERSGVSVLTHVVNRGKGAAVITGIREARLRGYSHVLQIDADAQHCFDDIPKFIDAAKRNPGALILGAPRFDETAPFARRHGRKLSTLLVWIESRSLAAADVLCGFRMYPVDSVSRVLSSCDLEERMGFDTEIIVRLLWKRVPIINIPTPVVYPARGISHFRYGRDNRTLVKLHTRLLLESVSRLFGLGR